MSDNSRKKEFLGEYRFYKREVRWIRERIEQLISENLGKAISYDGMPKATGGKYDLSDMAARVDEMIGELQRAEERYIARAESIEAAIAKMKDEAEREVLSSRYLNLRRWEEIADAMGYSKRHVLRIHGRALEHFELPRTRCH